MNNIGSKSKSNIEGLNYDELKKIFDNQEMLNYKQLCERLNIPILNGTSKTKQMRELLSVCKYEKIGRKYKVKELCDKEVLDLFNNRAIYLPYIQILLSQEFEKYNKDELYFSMRELMKNIGMFNDNFKDISGKDCYYKCSLIAQKYHLNTENLYKFVSKGYNSVLKPIIKSALNSMKNSKSIDLITGYKAYKIHKGQDYFNIVYIYTNIDESLGKEIFSIEGNTMSEMGINGSSELYGRKIYMQDEYHSTCNNKLKERKDTELYKKNNWDFDGFYRCYLIVINKKRLTHNVEQIRKDFNLLIQNKMITTKTLKFLKGEELEEFVKMMIDIIQKSDYNFKEDLRIQEELLNESVVG